MQRVMTYDVEHIKKCGNIDGQTGGILAASDLHRFSASAYQNIVILLLDHVTRSCYLIMLFDHVT